VIRWPRIFRTRKRRPTSPAEREQALRRCLVALVHGDPASAESELVALVRADSRDVDLYLLLGRLVHESGDVGRAIRIHQNLLLRADLDPGQRTRALKALAADLRAGGFLRRAVASYEEVRERLSRDPEVWAALTDLYIELGDFDHALAAWPRTAKLAGVSAADRDRRSARLWLAKARAAHAAGREDEARRALRKAVGRDARCAEAHLLQGRLEAERGRNKPALAAWQAAVGVDPATDREAYPLIASTYAALDRSADFEKWLRGRLEKEPGDVEGRIALAGWLAERGDRNEAIVEVRKVLEVAPDEHRARALLGRWLLDEGRKDEAASELLGWLSAFERGTLAASDGSTGEEGTP
jgi:lipopolysaccharide biosynthesis regulator YciM